MRKDNLINKKQAIDYLENVLNTWTEFCDTHRTFAKAIRLVLKGESNREKVKTISDKRM